jgi:fucose 4-O-acetylase-like acetyltransferase
MGDKREAKDIHSMGFFDLAKGLGMMIIILGHSYNMTFVTPGVGTAVDGARSIIFGKAVPLLSGAGSVLGAGVVAMFFMISGYSFFKRKPKKCLSLQAKLLLKPYALTGAAIVISKFIISTLRGRSFLEHGAPFITTFLFGTSLDSGGRIFGLPAESISILWFILSLFEVWVTYNLLVRIKKEATRHILIVCIVIAGYLMSLAPFAWPFMLPQSMIALGYFHVGYMCKVHKAFDVELPQWLPVLAGSVASFCLLFGSVNIARSQWGLGMIDLAGTFAVGFLMLLGYVKKLGPVPDNKITALISNVGFLSIWIVCIHGYEMCVFPWYMLTDALMPHRILAWAALTVLRSIMIWVIYKMITTVRKKFHRKKKVVLQ